MKNISRMLLAALLCMLITKSMTSCGDDDSPASSKTPDVIDLILNGSDAGSSTTYWHVDLGSTSGTSDWAFFENGTGRFRRRNYPATDGESFTWTKVGSNALLVSCTYDLPFTNFREIDGSISEGSFMAKLDTNETARLFALQAGTF